MLIKDFCLTYLNQLPEYKEVVLTDDVTGDRVSFTGYRMSLYRQWTPPLSEWLTKSIVDLDNDEDEKTISILVSADSFLD